MMLNIALAPLCHLQEVPRTSVLPAFRGVSLALRRYSRTPNDVPAGIRPFVQCAARRPRRCDGEHAATRAITTAGSIGHRPHGFWPFASRLLAASVRSFSSDDSGEWRAKLGKSMFSEEDPWHPIAQHLAKHRDVPRATDNNWPVQDVREPPSFCRSGPMLWPWHCFMVLIFFSCIRRYCHNFWNIWKIDRIVCCKLLQAQESPPRFLWR